MDDNTIGLLLLIHRLQQTGRRLSRETITHLAEFKLPEVAPAYDGLTRRLLSERLIDGTAESFTLTPMGAALVQDIAAVYSLHTWFYNAYYQATRRSKAHALFCERVYGRDLGQHGMADMAQLQLMLAELHLTPGMTLLDFGCGDGRIAEYIADTTQASVTGVDIADEAIRLALARTQAKRDRLRFCWADVERERGVFPCETFDCIYAIDSLFFARDQRSVLQVLLQRLAPMGRLAVFYLCPAQTPFDLSVLAESLKERCLSYVVHDLSAQYATHWALKKQALLDLEPMFCAEGNAFLFKNRLAECEGFERFHRCLYIINVAQ